MSIQRKVIMATCRNGTKKPHLARITLGQYVADFPNSYTLHPGPLSTPCFIWKGSLSTKGYAQFQVDYRLKPASHLAWLVAFNSFPPTGKILCHHCDDPRCVNIVHLFCGTKSDNNRDRDAKGRHVALKGEESKSSKLTDSAVKEIRSSFNLHSHSSRVLARKFGVDVSAIWKVFRRKTWKHL